MKYLLIETTDVGPATAFDCGEHVPVFDPARRAWLVAPATADAPPVYYTDGGEHAPRLRVQTAP